MSDLDAREDAVNVLDQLAATVRKEYQAFKAAESNAKVHESNALDHALNVGAALNAAQKRVSSSWKEWLRVNCFLGLSTAQLFQQLARHRVEIETEAERVGGLSVRAARRLIASSTKTRTKSNPMNHFLALWRRATSVERTTALASIPIGQFIAAMPLKWRTEIEARLRHGHAGETEGETARRPSEVLRKAVSLLRTVNAPTATRDEVGNAEREALVALRCLVNMLADTDIDEITIVKRYAKERRRAA